ncbi:MAG: glutamate racemase [Clostridia bacterium]|nr:glutamate racemase [Clostridia bacterium]
MENILKKEKNKPIGIFDSGLGGLTAVKAIKKLLPHEDIVYFGDTGRMPYGTKIEKKIISYANQDINFLKSKNVKMIISACGTVSSYVKQLNTPELITGVIKPSCQSAANLTKNHKIGIIGTSATIKSNAYIKELHKICPDAKIIQQDCPLLVPLIENGFTDKSSDMLCKAVNIYMKKFIEEKVDTLILGCTHYPIIKDVINDALGGRVNLINPGEETAKFIKKHLEENNLLSEKSGPGTYNFFISKETYDFSEKANLFLGYNIQKNTQRIDIHKY